ncbi:MAG: PD40 domain-containing protein [Candidatus Obscuribacter sp.]|nr:PD40 domain-containing protein [Candidatus Obscuribacter sp.]
MNLTRRTKIIIATGFCVLAALLLLLNLKEIIKNSPQYFGYRGQDLFGVYTSKLDGRHFAKLLSDPLKEMSHVRFAPDGSKITLTRYNRILSSGLAEENGSDYLNTEIMVANADGTELKSLTKTGPAVMNANSSWIDNERLIYVHTDDVHSKLPELRVLNIATKQEQRVPTPPNLAVADPTCKNDTLVFPVVQTSTDASACNPLWIANLSGAGLKQLTNPVITKPIMPLQFKLGDYDPWLSPDGSSVAFMRYSGGTDWRVYTVDVDTRVERELTPPGIACGIPKWSNDGKSIIYVSWDTSDLKKLGLYLIDPTGANKRQIALPAGYLYSHPSFVPDSGQTNTAQIVFSTRRVPALPGSPPQE